MSRLWVLAVGTVPLALAVVACDGSTSRSDSPLVTPSASAGDGGTVAAGGGAPAASGGGLGGGAGEARAGGGGQAAGESTGGNAAAGSVALGGGGSSNVGGMAGSAGAPSAGGTAWIIPATPGAAWSGPQDPACPAQAVSPNADCTTPPGTRCSYADSDGFTLRCWCYASSTGADRWWCQTHGSNGYDLCPVAYPGSGGCPNIGDVSCYYVDDQDKLEACTCSFGTSQCFLWGL